MCKKTQITEQEGFEPPVPYGHGNHGSYRAKRLDGVAEARLIAIACSSPPNGHNRWTVRLLADEMVSLGIVDSCGKTTVHNTLKKTNLSLT